MPIHPNLRKSQMSPKEKAAQLAEQSTDFFKPTNKYEPFYVAPLNINNRDLMISSIESIIHNKELSEEDRIWWKEVLSEIKKLSLK